MGTVISVLDTEELFKDILVEPFFRIQDLDELAIIKIDPNAIF